MILSIDGQAVDDPNAFDYRFATKPLGGRAGLGIERQGKVSNVTIQLEAAPDRPREEVVIRSRSPFQGAKVANLSPALAEELRLDASTDGVVIVDVVDNSTAAALGFRPGDLVLTVNGEKIARSRDLERATAESARVWRIEIQRGGQRLSLALGG